MNKQKAIEKIKNLNARETFMSEIIWVKRDDVLDIIKQLDEPEKPKVPQVAVEFYERYKDDNLALGEWFDDFYSSEAIEEFPRMDELTEWLYDNNDEINRQREFALATLVTLGIEAVEVEKEKLYTVEIPNPNHEECPILFKKGDGEVHIIFTSVPCWRTVKNAQLTESEIKKDFDWAFRWAKEVEE